MSTSRNSAKRAKPPPSRIFDAASKDAQSEVRTTQAAVRADAGVTRRALQAKMHEFTEAAMAKLLA